MNWFGNIRISIKLFLGFAIMLVLIGVVIATSYQGISRLAENERILFERHYATAMDIRQIRMNQRLTRINNMAMVLTKDPQKQGQLRQEGDTLLRENEAILGRLLEREKSDPELSNDLKVYDKASRDYADGREKLVVASILGGRIQAAIEAIMTVQADSAKTMQDIGEKLDQAVTKAAERKIAEVSSITIASQRTLLLVGLFAFAAALVLVILLNRLIALPLGKSVQMIQGICKGELGTRLKMSRKDEIGILADTMDQLAEMINSLISDMNDMSLQQDSGDLDVKIGEDKYLGAFNVMAKGVNDMVFGHIAIKKKAMACVSEFGKGNFEAPLEQFPGKKAFINETIEQVRHNLKALIADTEQLTKAAEEGKLSVRVDVERHQGDFRRIIKGINDAMDAMLLPIGEANRILSLIRGGDLRERVEIACKGDHAKMKDAVNGVHDWLAELIDYVTKIANGDMTAAMTKASDTDQIHEWLMLMKDNIKALAADAIMLTKAGVEGKLATRADASKHRGEFRTIVQGVNDTLDAVIGPLNVAAGYVDRIAKGEIPKAITDKCKGDFELLTINLNKMSDNLRNLNKELQSGFGILASSSTEILATVSQVAASASETATAVSETSTTAEEVKQTAHLSNQKAKAVQESALKAAAISEAGRKAVAETIEGMNRIREQMESIAESVVRLSEQGQTIGEIIATVNDLAEQSNLLAVNAAIEATRAGESGKAFAVVAQEVKGLAEQSRQATTQVRTILMEVQKATSAAVMATEQGSKAVAAGVVQATEAGESIGALAGSVGEAAQAAMQIAASSQQQLVGMDQIASAISNIQQATSQNMAGTKQLEASAKGLQELGGRLKIMVERQKVEG